MISMFNIGEKNKDKIPMLLIAFANSRDNIDARNHKSKKKQGIRSIRAITSPSLRTQFPSM